MPLSNFEPRGFGFVHHSIATLYHEVPNPNLTIRNCFIAVRRAIRGAAAAAAAERERERERVRVRSSGRGAAAGEVLPLPGFPLRRVKIQGRAGG